MISAAEKLVAEKGLAAMSLRAVQEAAGQRNKSAAQYHFGTRAKLVEAVVNARMAPINERRIDMIFACDGSIPLRQLVEIFVVPVVESVLESTPSYWARFVLQGALDPTLRDVVVDNVEGEAYRTLSRRMRQQLDHLPEELALRRFDHIVGMVFMNLAALEQRRAAGMQASISDALIVGDLIDVCVAVLQAPSSTLELASLADSSLEKGERNA